MAEKEKKTAVKPETKKEAKEEKDDKHYIVLTDEEGKDVKVQLLFSIKSPDNDDMYLYIVDPSDEDAVVIFKGDNDGNLEMVDEKTTDKKVMDFLQDTFQAFLQGDLEPVNKEGGEEEKEDEDECECGSHHHHEHEEGKECCCHDDKEEHHHKEGECCCGDEKCTCGGKEAK